MQWIALNCFTMHCNVLHCTALHWTWLHCTASSLAREMVSSSHLPLTHCFSLHTGSPGFFSFSFSVSFSFSCSSPFPTPSCLLLLLLLLILLLITLFFFFLLFSRIRQSIRNYITVCIETFCYNPIPLHLFLNSKVLIFKQKQNICEVKPFILS